MLAETKMLSDSPACEMATIKACDVTMGVTPGIKVEIAFYLDREGAARGKKNRQTHTLGPGSKVSTEKSPQVIDRLSLYLRTKRAAHAPLIQSRLVKFISYSAPRSDLVLSLEQTQHTTQEVK